MTIINDGGPYFVAGERFPEGHIGISQTAKWRDGGGDPKLAEGDAHRDAEAIANTGGIGYVLKIVRRVERPEAPFNVTNYRQ